MTKFYRQAARPYFRPSEFFVNGRDHGIGIGSYPIEGECIGGEESLWKLEAAGILSRSVVEKLRMRVDIVELCRNSTA
jgi:hypothetical protein